jgi:hypothetical protein
MKIDEEGRIIENIVKAVLYLKPIRILRTLLSSKNLNKTFIFVATQIACISTRKMSVEGRGIELSKNIDLRYVAI